MGRQFDTLAEVNAQIECGEVRPEVDGIELDLSKLYTKGSSDTSKTDVGMVGLLYSLAETAVFGSIEQTDNSNLWDIMIRLYQVVMQMQEIEEINKKK